MKSRDDVFFEIIAYLNDNNMQDSARLWHTEAGSVWIWYSGTWRQQWFDDAEWPITEEPA
jgi:hypothetical protein